MTRARFRGEVSAQGRKAALAAATAAATSAALARAGLAPDVVADRDRTGGSLGWLAHGLLLDSPRSGSPRIHSWAGSFRKCHARTGPAMAFMVAAAMAEGYHHPVAAARHHHPRA